MIYVSLLCIAWTGGLVGYVLGLVRPIRRARNWARWRLHAAVPGRLMQALVLILLPDLTVPLLWHRLRHGAYPQPTPPQRRPAPKLSPHWREKIPRSDQDPKPTHLPEG